MRGNNSQPWHRYLESERRQEELHPKGGEEELGSYPPVISVPPACLIKGLLLWLLVTARSQAQQVPPEPICHVLGKASKTLGTPCLLFFRVPWDFWITQLGKILYQPTLQGLEPDATLLGSL